MLSKWEAHTHYPWSVRAIRICRAQLDLIDGNLSTVERWAQEKQLVEQPRASEQEEELPHILQQEDVLLLVGCISRKRKGKLH
jgi:hypothetical protein